MSARDLVVALRSAGLTVVEDPGWDTRGAKWAAHQPIGQMIHHTAPPVPYPIDGLNGSRDGRIKCNINTKPDGTIVLIAYLATNYSSGMGSKTVYDETVRDIAPPANASTRGLADNINGNPHYWNNEVDALGNGTPIPQVQYDAVVTAARVVNDHFRLTSNKVISHAEWTARKIDPYWNGSRRTAAAIRADLEADDMPLSEEDVARIAAACSDSVWFRNAYSGTKDGKPINIAFQIDRIYRTGGDTFELAKVTNENTNRIIEMLEGIPGADLAAVARAVADEQDRRVRERLEIG